MPELTDEEKLGLLEVALDHYGIAHRGVSWEQKIRCPLGVHEDNHPSASANLGKGMWTCHACQRGGDGLTLIMEREHVEYVDAVTVAVGILAGGQPTVSGSDDPGGPLLAARKGSRRRGDKFRFTWGGAA